MNRPKPPVPPSVIERRKAAVRDHQELSTLLGFKVPIDGFISALASRLSIDLFRLEETFRRGNKAYQDDESLDAFIRRHYGARAAFLLDALI